MQPNQQLSFILRLWCAGQSTTADWRASIENPETGKRIGFASLEQLFAYLIDMSESNCILKPKEDKAKEENDEK